MSYSMKDAQLEIALRIDECLQTCDVGEAYALADLFAEMGDDEEASKFRKMARAWDYGNDRYDQDRDNGI